MRGQTAQLFSQRSKEPFARGIDLRPIKHRRQHGVATAERIIQLKIIKLKNNYLLLLNLKLIIYKKCQLVKPSTSQKNIFPDTEKIFIIIIL